MTESFDEVKCLFESLSKTLDKNKESISAIYVDNCCKWRNQLSSVLPEVPVKLDLFHAVQRVTRKISKRSVFHKELSRDYSLVFREQHDQGEQRNLPTPNIATIIANLNRFKVKWKDIRTPTGNLILTSELLKELKNIEIHIRRGCLSNIPPGCGTARNERLHRELKKISVKNKISIDLAKARMEIILYYENRKKDPTLPSVEELLLEEQKSGVRIKSKYYTKSNKSNNKKRI